MVPPSPAARVRLERLPPFAWGAAVVVTLAVVYAALHVAFVRPYLWPAGPGARLQPDPAARWLVRARPPDVRVELGGPLRVTDVVPRGPAARAGIGPGMQVVAVKLPDDPLGIDFHDTLADPAARLARWRGLYWTGVRGPIQWTIRQHGAAGTDVVLDRVPAWHTMGGEWTRRHLGVLLQVVVFAGCALVLLLLRSYDPTATLCVLALALSAVAGGGPLLGAERALPFAGPVLTVFAWLATPLAFPVIALAILYFPTRSALLVRRPLLHAVPWLVSAPMILTSLATSLYLSGFDSLRAAAAWEAARQGIYYASFAAALVLNLLVIAEGLHRYRHNPNANERRRIRVVVYTGVPAVLAFAVKDGVPVLAAAAGAPMPEYPLPVSAGLQGLVLLAGFGLVYAVGVARVLGPRVVLRRSLQYALASRTLTVLAVLPLLALALTLVRNRDRTIGEIAAGGSGLNLLLAASAVAAFRYRERARHWLDQRFFRAEYDARRILLSLADRVQSESDPDDLAGLVVTEIDDALHPQMTAILVTGVDEGRLTPVTVLHGSAESIPLDGGLMAMLRWSDEPLELFPDDPRSPVRRLPPEEQEWLQCTGAALLVPVLARDRSLVAVIVLGERRSEEAYTAEDRQLLSTIAAQMGLGFDVARLRRGVPRAATMETRTAITPRELLAECPRCGRCEDMTVKSCPADGAAMKPVPFVRRIVDGKYRIEQLIGRGGMGAVYRTRDLRLERHVALKIVRPELLGDPDARERFRREAQIVARLQHPSIVAVYDYGTFEEGGAYLVMELVRGEDLRHLLHREGRLPPDRALRILVPICSAIDAAHREGVLHRDLKPENILLPAAGGDPKVFDFGVAKIVEDEQRGDEGATAALTAAGVVVGTPAYMAPEQFRGTATDVRTDVFSLGVIAYEMVSGELPFGRGTLAEVLLAHPRGVPPIRGVTLPAGVERAIRTALDPDPDRRPPSPQAFGHLMAASLRLV